jgi:4'-phosphopantetheinyl transferase EntD
MVRDEKSDCVAPSSAFAALLPIAARAMETRNFCQLDWLDPLELAAVANAAPRRIETFAAGRRCAHRALAALGVPEGPVRVGPGRAPVWPPGIAGSITHTEGFAAAAVMRHADAISIGIDAERIGRVDAGIERQICVMEESDRLGRLAPVARAAAATQVFAAKEAFMKAQFPITGRMPDFRHILVRWDEDRFDATTIEGHGGWHASGRSALVDGFALAAVVIGSGDVGANGG